jgi:sugar phosphate isomerase/epimerase
MEDIQNLKDRYPFRLGTTSYIIPADLLANAAFLADRVDDIELVLFESDEISPLPTPDTVKALKDLAGRLDLSYTVHLPLDTWPGHADEILRRRSVDKYLRIIEGLAPLAPFAWILHFHGDHSGAEPSPEPARWLAGLRRSVETLLQSLRPFDLCIETIDYPFVLVEDIISDYGLAICLDIGHLLRFGYSPEDHLDRYLGRTRVLHLHGVEAGRDHRSLVSLPDGLLTGLLNRLNIHRELKRVLTIEVFSENALEQSLDLMSRHIRQISAEDHHL